MSIERRFGSALLVLAVGNVVLAAVNAATGSPPVLYGAELVAALGLGVLGGAFLSERHAADVDSTGRTLMAYGAYVLAATGIGLVFVGVVLLVGE